MKEITNTPTAAPKFRNPEVTAVALDTECKTTQANTFTKRFAAKTFTIMLPYESKREYAVGEEVRYLTLDHGGYCMTDGYHCHIIWKVLNEKGETVGDYFIPAEFITERMFTTVREYKTTTWEVFA